MALFSLRQLFCSYTLDPYEQLQHPWDVYRTSSYDALPVFNTYSLYPSCHSLLTFLNDICSEYDCCIFQFSKVEPYMSLHKHNNPVHSIEEGLEKVRTGKGQVRV